MNHRIRVAVTFFSIKAGALHVYLGKGWSFSVGSQWALPSNFVTPGRDFTLEDTASGVARDFPGVLVSGLRHIVTVGGPNREVHGDWTTTIVFRAFIRDSEQARQSVATADARWVDAGRIAKFGVAFDHAHLVQISTKCLQDECEAFDFPYGLIPERFTLTQLRGLTEVILGRQVDKATFRRQVLERKIVEARGVTTGSAHRPARLYSAADQ